MIKPRLVRTLRVGDRRHRAHRARHRRGPFFRPDDRFEGSSLSRWRPLGAAEWRADKGEIAGVPKDPSGGWLVLDRSYQDTGFFTSFKCAAGCRTGVLLRAEKTPDGMKGVLVSLTEGDVGAYALTLDSNGREVKRTPLGFPGAGQNRIAPPPDLTHRPRHPPALPGAEPVAAEGVAASASIRNRTPASTPANGTTSGSCSTRTSSAPSSTTPVRAALRTMTRAGMDRLRSTSAAPQKCDSRTSHSRILRSAPGRTRRCPAASACSA